MVKEEKKKKHHYFFKLLFLIIISLVLYSRYISTTGLIVKEYIVKDSKLPSNFIGFKIVHFSDLHFGTTVSFKELENIVNEINKLKPNIVVFTGDLIDKDTELNKDNTEKFISLLSKIDADVKKLAVKGNHDYNKNNSFDVIMESSGFIILNNSYELVYYKGLTPIYIAGFPSSIKEQYNIQNTFSYYDTLTEQSIIPEYKIVLMHEPDNIDKLNDYNINLALAGHSHNGQVRIPFVGAIIIPKGSKIYYENHYKVNNTELFVSSGIGTSGIKFRFNNKPSINFYRLSK